MESAAGSDREVPVAGWTGDEDADQEFDAELEFDEEDAPEPDGGAGREPGAAEPAGPDEQARRILEFERRWWRTAGAKEQAILDTFGLTPTRYYQLLNALLDDPAVVADDPVLVNRLRRLRSRRSPG